MIEESGVNVVAANVGMNIEAFLASAEKMMTNLEALNLQLREISTITINPMINMGPVNAMNSQRISTEAETVARINAIEQEGQLTQARIQTEGLRQQRMIQTEQLAASEGIFSGYFSRLQGMTMHHINWFLTGGLLLFGGDLFKQGVVDFEKNLAGVQQVLEETYQKMGQALSPEMMAAMGESFSQIAERWGQSVQEVLQGAKDWGRQYKDLNTIQELVNSSTLLSVVDNLSLTESVKGLEATMNQYGMVATSAAQAQEYSMRIVDSWSAVAHKSMISALDLAQGNEKAASSARMVGVDFDNLQGMLAAAVRATGRSGNELGNTLKTMFASLHSDKAVSELHKLGVEVKDLEGNFRPAQQVFADLMIAMSGTKQNIESVVQAVSSGKFQWSKAAAILGDYDTYIKATAQSINSAGLAQEYMAVQMDTVSRKAGQLHQALIALTTSAGNAGLTGALKAMLDNLRYLVDGLNNGGMKAVAFGVAIVGLANVMNAITTATRAARVAQEELTTVQAAGRIVAGGWVSILTTLVTLGVAAYTINLGKAADAQIDFNEKQKQSVEQHKQMADQYGTQITFLEQLEEQHNKLSKALNNSATAGEQKAQLNKDLQATEEALSITVGDSTATTIKNANYSHQAFQSVVTSLQGKQESEKIAWHNSSQLVAEATVNLQNEVQAQIAEVEKVSKAYSWFGKIQETFLAGKKFAGTIQLNVAQFNVDHDPNNDLAKESLQEAKDNIGAIEAEISNFYDWEKKQELLKLDAKMVKIGTPFNPSTVPDIPTGSGFNSEPMADSPKAKTAAQLDALAKKADEAAKKLRELAVTMADNKVRFYTDDVKMLDAQMKNTGENLVGLIAKETDYANALTETHNERVLIQSQIKELSVDTAKYADEIENLKKKDMDLAVSEQELISKQAEMMAQKIKAAYQEKELAEEAAVQAKIDKATSDQKAYDTAFKAEQDNHSTNIKNIEKATTASNDYYDTIISGLNDQSTALDKAITANDTYYSSMIDPLNAQLTALDKTNTALDAQNKLLDLRSKLSDLEKEKANIENEKSIRVIGADGKWTYQADQTKLNDVNSKIKDAQTAVSDQETTMARDAEKQGIQDQITALQDLQTAEKKRLEDSKAVIADQITSYQKTKELQAKALSDAKAYQQNLLTISQEQQATYDAVAATNINDLNLQKTALGTYWKGVLDDTKINQAALIELNGKGYAQSLTDADKYYSDAKIALDKFGEDAMASAKRIHDSIAASLAIASQNINVSNDNSVTIGTVNTGNNLSGVLSAAKQLASM